MVVGIVQAQGICSFITLSLGSLRVHSRVVSSMVVSR